MARYRLTISTARAATHFCIAAATEDEARQRAGTIASQLDMKNARIVLMQAGSSVAQPIPAPRRPGLLQALASPPRTLSSIAF